MKGKRMLLSLLLAGMIAGMALPASALEYTIDAPGDPEYGKPTSVEPVVTADRGERKNEDLSKNAALIPPVFGSPSAYALFTGTYLTPNLAPATSASGSIIGGGTVTPPAVDAVSPNYAVSTGYTEVTDDLYYTDGSLGTLSIPTLGVSARIVQGTDNAALAKGIGHFEETSIWDGNVAFASHNRGVSSYFGEIHTLNPGDTITLTTKLGTRTYAVTSVSKVSETDRSKLAASTTNILTLYTCVRDQRDQRWCVQAEQLV